MVPVLALGSGAAFVLGIAVVLGLVFAIVSLLGYVSRGKPGDVTASRYGDAAATRVRAEVDKAATLIIDLTDRTDLPGTPPEARSWFRQGATAFADLQGELEAADTRPELEALWPKLRNVTWRLEGAQAILAGQPAPAPPVVTPLFAETTVFGTAPSVRLPGEEPVAPLPPTPAPAPLPAPVPGSALPPPTGYQSYERNPFLTPSAVTALGLVSGEAPEPARPPADDDWFRQRFGGPHP